MNLPAPKQYKCAVCLADGINEDNKVVHHAKMHSDKPFTDQDFELSTKGEGVKCDACGAKMKEGRLKGHMRRVHPEILNDKEEVSQDSKITRRLLDHQSSNAVTLKLYKCQACDANEILESNRIEHHLKKHDKIPIDDNIFRLIGITHRDNCDVCGKHMRVGQLSSHKFRFHSQIRHGCVYQRGSVTTTTDTSAYVQLPSASSAPKSKLVHRFKTTIVEYHKCGLCGVGGLLKDQLNGHSRRAHKGAVEVDYHVNYSHEKCSKKMSTKNITFELMVTKKRCGLCRKRLKEEQIGNHMKMCHPRLNDVKIGKVYKCGLCDVWCKELSFKDHHDKYHGRVPYANNHFKFGKIKQKFPCDFCGQRICVGRKSKHQLTACLQYANKKKMLQRLIYLDDERFE